MKDSIRKLWTSLVIGYFTLPTMLYADNVEGRQNTGSTPTDTGGNISAGTFGDDGSFQINTSGDNSFVGTLKKIFGSETFGISENDIATGTKLASPLISLINTFTIGLYLIIVYIFFGQTTVDLLYIFCPIVRGMMEKRAESKGFGDGRSGGNFCISESAYKAVHGDGGSGGMGGGGERSYGTAILKYVGTRVGELAVFIFFSILFLGGLIGELIIAIFYLAAPILESLLSIS